MSLQTNLNTDLLQEVKNYWELRSASYSKQNIAELHCFKRDAWQKLILNNAPPMDQLRVLDIGTGPGFFAINLALSGHNVTAVDMTPAMLDKAAQNAWCYGANVRFEQAHANELPFPDGTFDLVVSRNVVWNLEKPEKALQEWARVLSPGGRMIYYDANWYLYLFDQQQQFKYEKTQKEATCLDPRDYAPSRDMGMKMEAIARNLPLSSRYRPQWDRMVLEKMGLKIIRIQENIGELVWDEEEQIRYAATPMFMICAEL